ncbi:MAG: transformation protein [Actinomycetota bacterium]|nr:transformation protein [Actinomycetota bacterium]
MSDDFLEYVLARLNVEGVHSRPMFGGTGLYSWGRFFGIVYNSELFFKIDDATRPRYEAKGMKQFTPQEGQTLRTFYQVPAEVLESRLTLHDWAEDAARAAAQ